MTDIGGIGGDGNLTVMGTSPEMPVASQRESSVVTFTVKKPVPQFPGQKSMVSSTVKVMEGLTVKVPFGSRVIVAEPSARRSSF